MKLSMETVYVSESSFSQKKEMMSDWTHTSDYAARFSCWGAVMAFIGAVIAWVLKDEFFFINFGTVLVYLIGAAASKKWKYVGYVAVIIAFMLSCSRFFLTEEIEKLTLSAYVIVAVVGLIPFFYAFRCIYNYSSVFKELEKCKGFPSFIANTADLYGEKLYLKTEDKSAYENRTEVSFNPFNTQEDIIKESTQRYHDTKVKSKAKPIEMNIGVDGKLVSAEEEERLRKEKEAQAKKGGLSIGGFELIFPHSDLENNDHNEKRILMGKWRENLDRSTKSFVYFTLLLMLCVMTANFGSLVGMLNYIVVLVFIIGTNQMKMGKWYAPITLILAFMYTTTFLNSVISAFLLVAAYIVNFRMLVGILVYILNYKIYKKLSTQEGFPSFIRTTADLYADKMYIVEKPVINKKTEPSQRVVRVMDIGLDDKPKKDEGAWNAFNYMDEKDDKNEG